MTLSDTSHHSALARLARPSGTFAMVAMDQRESLRAMFAERLPEPIELERRVAFKIAVAEILSPHASALLVDQPEGLDPILEAGALDLSCGLIIAADELAQPAGAAVDDTRLDRSIDLADAARRGAVAAKLLVIWKPDRSAADRATLVNEFLDVSRAAGLAGIVEGVVRPPAGVDEPDWTEREEGLLEATRELGALKPDIYKAQVPFNGLGDPEPMVERCREMTAMLPCPWVVLSSGVTIDRFASAVEAACRGGASGFLAGRAVWRDALVEHPEPLLRERSVPRLRELGAIVDAHARPWTDAPSPAGDSKSAATTITRGRPARSSRGGSSSAPSPTIEFGLLCSARTGGRALADDWSVWTTSVTRYRRWRPSSPMKSTRSPTHGTGAACSRSADHPPSPSITSVHAVPIGGPPPSSKVSRRSIGSDLVSSALMGDVVARRVPATPATMMSARAELEAA